jgi:hypothetical protein
MDAPTKRAGIEARGMTCTIERDAVPDPGC